MSDLLTAAPLSGFLPGYQQGQANQRQQAIDIANQIAQQHQDELAQQQAEFAQQKQAEVERKNAAAEKLGNDKLDLAKQEQDAKVAHQKESLKGAAERAGMRFDQHALDRVQKETDLYTLQGLSPDEAHARAVGNETLRQHGVPSHQIPGSIPFDMTGQQTLHPEIVPPTPPSNTTALPAQGAPPPNGGNIALPNLTPPPSAPPENPAGAALGNFGAGSVGGATTAQPNTPIAPTPMPSLLSIPSLNNAVTTGQATPSAPVPQIGTPATPDLVSVPSVANVFGTGQPTAMPPAPIVGSSAAPVPSPAPVPLPPPVQALQGAVQPPTTITTPGHSGQLIPGGSPLTNQGPLPMVQNKLDLGKAKIAHTDASTENLQTRTEQAKIFLDPKLEDLISKTNNREWRQKNIEQEQKFNNDLKKQTFDLNSRVQATRLALAQAARNDAHMTAIDRHNKSSSAPNPAELVAMRQLAQDKAQSVGMWKAAVKERDKLVSDTALMQSTIGKPQPLRSDFDTDTKFNQAITNWQNSQRTAKAFVDTANTRINELNGHIENLNSGIEATRNILLKHTSAVNPDGTLTPITGGGKGQKSSQALPPGWQPSDAQNVSFNVGGDRNRVNQQFLNIVNQEAQKLGYKVTVGTAISGHSTNIMPHGHDTGRQSQHAVGEGFDVNSITGPDGKTYNVNVNDGKGAALAYKLAKAVHDRGQRVIFGVDNDIVGNHNNHLHIGYSPEGVQAPAYLGNGTPAPKAKTAPPASTSGKTNPAPTARTAAPTRYIYNPATGKMTPAK